MRNRLVENITSQDAIAETLDGTAKEAVGKYRESLWQMKKATEDTKDVLSMGPFWESASDLLVAKDQMLKQLRLQVGGTS